uniref:Transposase Synechocystis PCC 6803 domain-containing protein n=1 Tax=Panagrolaimus sp. PS1159 TaxID=55785 RepID=A0AC35GQS9_9BILA
MDTNNNSKGESLCSDKRSWKKVSSSSNTNNSTLSLHNAAYEALIAPYSVGDIKDDGFKMKKSDSNKQLFSDSTIQNPFEFPRQQEQNRTPEPEVMGFRASQRLRNPNQGSSSSYQSKPETKEHIRHYMKIIFDKNPEVTAEEMEKEIESTYPLDAPSTRTCYRWIKEFKSGEQIVKLKDHERSGRPGKLDETELHDFVLANPNMTVKMFAEHFGCATGTISNHLKKLDIVHKFGRWIPHRLTPANISRHVHFEFVPDGHTVDKFFYRRMLDRVQQALIEKRGAGREVFFLQDNAPAHRAKITKEKIEELGWTLLPHPPYSPCLSPSDYHAFLSLSNWLQDKIFENDDQLRQSIQEWIDEKPSGFWVRGFTKLPERWQKCINAHGNYFEDD